MINFFNSNFFIALTTFLVGSFAILLYLLQKRSFKRDAASLILQEIRYAEQQIRNARELPNLDYQLSTKLLPTNSWHQNIHLFINELKETDIDLISSFYAKAKHIDHMIETITNLNSQIPNIFGQPPMVEEEQVNTPKDPQQNKSQKARIVTFKINAQIALEQTTKDIEFIYNTTVVEKLRKIAAKKKLFFF